MYSKKIGRRVGLLYEQWAWHLEDMGNTKKASAVLAKGISNEASSVARLEKLRTDLEVRLLSRQIVGLHHHYATLSSCSYLSL